MFTKWRRLLLYMTIAVLTTGIIFIAGCNNQSSNQGDQPGLAANSYSLPGVGPDTVADVVSNSSTAVVKISTQKVSSAQESDPFFSDPFFRQFFGQPYDQRQHEEGLGSGFLISSDGYILTNEHVIDGAEQISVTVSGYENTFEASVTGADYDLDLALLKINAQAELPFLNLGNSDQIRVGNWVIAIGNPYGLDHTVTTGVISAKGRPVIIGDRQYENLLQTDASINPGNSGGPLLNLQGEVIGINTAISAEAQGIGFAIPTSTVQRVLEDLKSGQNEPRPWIGVQVRPVDEEIARYLGLSQVEGAAVAGVVNGSPAQKAGLRMWDVIVEFNGVKINNDDELVAAIKNVPVGSKVGMMVVRNRQLYAININVAEKPRNIK
ncbi:MAG: trypsin-like peptidase domain-containing protein [Desulfotomaculaceae bacterium]|nr:trypsin-like peptidase domain-containing protein [Desulfotomaculaceae bacterium]